MMKLPGAYRRLLAGMLILSLLLSLAGYAAVPSSADTFRVVRVHGRKVRLRDGIPPQLTHKNVIRHLRKGELLFADRIGYGIGYDGKGRGEWMHVIDLRNGECGWVNSHYVDVVDLVGGEADEKRHSVPTDITERRAADAPEASPVHDTPPPDAGSEEPTFLTKLRKKFGPDIQFVANIANIIAVVLSATMLMMHVLAGAPGSRAPAAATASATTASASLPTTAAPAALGSISSEYVATVIATEAEATSRIPNFIYGVSDGVPYRILITKR